MKHRIESVSRLIQLARNGAPGAVDQLLEMYRNYLGILAFTSLDGELRGKLDPSDLVQETFLKANRSFGQFRGATEAEITGWLRQILSRNLVDQVRRFRATASRALGRERSLDRIVDHSSQALARLLPASGRSPSQSAERREMAVVLADAVARLPNDHREVILLRNLEECEWEEVARRMGRSTGAVRMLWTRALKQLRPLLEEKL